MLDVLAVLPWAVFTVLAPLVFRRRPNLSAYPPADTAAEDSSDLPLVSVIVPARNEAENIGACLATLLASSYPRREIIVVDDRSGDGTGEVAHAVAERCEEGEVRVVDGDLLPDGWIGKPWACWQGYRAARGELLLFTDADTRHGPELVGRMVSALRAEGADLVSVMPRQVLVSFWERVIMPHVGLVIRLRYPSTRRVSRTRTPRDAAANGQIIMVRREAYEAVGGHKAVAGEVVEDLRLAQQIVAAGRRIFLAHAERFIETRMYRSLEQIIEGWSKNLAAGARHTVDRWLRPAVPWLIALFLLLFWVAPPAALGAATFGGAGRLFAWSAVSTGLSLLFWLGVCVSLRVPPLYTLLYPLGATMAAWLFVRSALLGEEVTWRGRVYGRPGSPPRPG